MSDRRVLLVDDDASNRTSLAWLLEDAGFVVVAVGSLAEARRKLDPDIALAVLDVHLTDGLGTSLIPEVRAVAPRARIAVVSGTASGEDLSGADLALTKGAEPAAAIAALVALVER